MANRKVSYLYYKMPSWIHILFLSVVIAPHSSHLGKLLNCSPLLYHRDLYHTYMNVIDVQHP